MIDTPGDLTEAPDCEREGDGRAIGRPASGSPHGRCVPARRVQRAVVHGDTSIAALRKQAVQDGMHPLRLAGAMRAAEGLTTLAEIIAATPPLQ